MDITEIVAQFAVDAPGPAVPDHLRYGAWFRRMAAKCELSDTQLAEWDIAALNLEAALGLPGAENLDIDAGVATLASWAKQIRRFTEKHWHLFQKRPEDFGNSSAEFRMMTLMTWVQRDMGVRYNLAFSQGDYDGLDSRSLFIHGILQGQGGTCASLPVLYVALGRRLGYPLTLVQACEHWFVRWEEPAERFNIECTSLGFRRLDDAYYLRWPKPLTQVQLQSGCYLRILRPREELAMFLCERGNCLTDHLRLGEALLACFLAAQLAPEHAIVRGRWAIVTVLARALEHARREMKLPDYEDLNLRTVPVPAGRESYERWAAPFVREHLQRIASLRERAYGESRDARLAPIGGAWHEHSPP